MQFYQWCFCQAGHIKAPPQQLGLLKKFSKKNKGRRENSQISTLYKRAKVSYSLKKKKQMSRLKARRKKVYRLTLLMAKSVNDMNASKQLSRKTFWQNTKGSSLRPPMLRSRRLCPLKTLHLFLANYFRCLEKVY